MSPDWSVSVYTRGLVSVSYGARTSHRRKRECGCRRSSSCGRRKRKRVLVPKGEGTNGLRSLSPAERVRAFETYTPETNERRPTRSTQRCRDDKVPIGNPEVTSLVRTTSSGTKISHFSEVIGLVPSDPGDDSLLESSVQILNFSSTFHRKGITDRVLKSHSPLFEF